ncbi:MAG TPA: CAP domain-containing protein [Pyrinomonadaceae bacterium]
MRFAPLFCSFLILMAAAATLQAQTKQSQEASFLLPQEREIISEINLARSNPAQYVAYLEQLRKYYAGKEIRRPGQPVEVTMEGETAIEEAIQYVRSLKPLQPFSVYQGMCLAAKDHLKDLGKTGSTGHKGSDGSIPEERLNRYGNWQKTVGENIVYGSSTARDTVMGWIIDDGNPTRGHRLNIFSQNFSAMGIALGERSNYGTMCVNTFAGGFAEKSGGAQGSQAQGPSETGKPAARKF